MTESVQLSPETRANTPERATVCFVATSPFLPLLQTREESIAAAWEQYSEQVDGLAGKAYEKAEEQAWDELQAELAEIERRHPPATV